MKRLLLPLGIVILAIFIIAGVYVFKKSDLPDYQKNGRLEITWSCDDDKTTVNVYEASKWPAGNWAADEYLISSGDVVVEYFSQDKNDGFHVKLAGTKKFKAISYEEFNALLREKAPSAYNYIHGMSNDCKMTERGQQ